MARALDVLERPLRDAGLAPERLPFQASEWRAEAASVLWLVAALWTALFAARRSRRAAVAATGLVIAGIACFGGTFDRVLPRDSRDNLQITIAPRRAAQREIVLTAHYDTKTEPLDHVERGLLAVAVAGLAAITAVAWRTRSRATSALAWTTALGLVVWSVQFGAGRWIASRSPGAADDATAALLLVDVARAVAAAPLDDCRLTCVWFASEERGAQGSAAWARARRRASEAPPECVVLNLECLGAGPDLGIMMCEWAGWRAWRPDAGLVAALDAASSVPLQRFRLPALTDSGPCRRAGIAAATLLGLENGGRPPRHLHRAADSIAELDSAGVRLARGVVLNFVANCDAAAARPGR